MPIPVEVARKHLEDALTYIEDRYKAGVEHAEWKRFAIAGEDAFKEAMQLVIKNELRKKGIEKVDDEVWRSGCIDNADKLRRNLEDALDKWEANFRTPYNRVLAILRNLPPKTLDWEQNIEKRLKPVVRAWKGLPQKR